MRVLLLLSLSTAAFPQGAEYIKANYTKYEAPDPARDGRKLFTSIYVPKDESRKMADPVQPHALQRRPLRHRQLPQGPRPQ